MVEAKLTNPYSSLSDFEDEPRLRPVIQLAQICEFEVNHSQHVTFLALRLFDQLQELHHMGAKERFWLTAGGLLHDIGWVEGWRSHHKRSMRIILETPMLPFTSKERLIVGSIARYHRKGLPKPKHDNFAALGTGEKVVVSQLAAFLRLADGLDRNHCNLVKDLTSQVSDDRITILCDIENPAEDEIAAGLGKKDLLQKVFKKKIDIQYHSL